MSRGLSEEEAQRYDRQVRIWGAEAQVRLQTSKVLLIGLRGLNAEVAKNLGLNPVVIEDLGHNFFIHESDVGRNLAEAMIAGVQELNSFTTLRFSAASIADTPDSYFLDFDIIVYGGWSESEAIRLNRICRSKSPNVSFFWSGVFGEESWFISDFGASFQYKNDPPKDKEIQTGSSFSLEEIFSKKWSDTIAKRIPLSKTYVKSRILSRFRDLSDRYEVTESDLEAVTSLSTKLFIENGLDPSSLKLREASNDALTQEDLKQLCRVAMSIPVIACSVLGSYLAQEIVKSISRSGYPDSAVFIFDGANFEVRAFPIDMKFA